MTHRLASWTDVASPFEGRLAETDAHVWRIALDSEHCHWDAACGTLSADEQRRAASYKRPVDRDRFAHTRGALRLLLSAYCGVVPERLEWLVSPEGKPRLDPACGADGIEFNVSHSGEIALVAISRRRVGIDVERLRPGVDCLAIARRYFSPREVAQLESLDDGELVPAFFRCWTRKEAFVKATGKGIASGLAAFSVSLLPGEEPKIVDPACDAAGWQLFDFQPAEGYLAALAVEGVAGASVSCRAWSP